MRTLPCLTCWKAKCEKLANLPRLVQIELLRVGQLKKWRMCTGSHIMYRIHPFPTKTQKLQNQRLSASSTIREFVEECSCWFLFHFKPVLWLTGGPKIRVFHYSLWIFTLCTIGLRDSYAEFKFSGKHSGHTAECKIFTGTKHERWERCQKQT